MTDSDFRSLLVDDARLSRSVHGHGAAPLPFFETTELRWFATGPLPADVESWFTGSTGVLEQRCDTYLLDRRGDIGVKRRFRETLELKVRQSFDEQIDLGEGFAGSLEVWRRWSPATGLVGDGSDRRWVDVRKSIVKRRFSLEGTETAFSPVEPVTGAGCDVEVADVTVGAVRTWTIAFAAFGPLATRQQALSASFQGLMGSSACPKLFSPWTGRAMSYPEWLSLTV